MESDTVQKRDQFLTITLAVLLFVSPLLYIGALRDPSNLPRYTLLALGLCIAAIIFVYFLFKGLDRVRYTPVLLLAFVYFVLAGISAQWAVDHSTNLVFIVRLLCYVGLAFIAAQIASERSAMIFIGVSLVSAGLTALIGLLQNHGLNIFHLRGYAMGGTFSYKNFLALYLDLIIPAGFMLLLASKNKLLKYAFAACLTICLIYILNSHTRGSYVALTVAGILALVGYVSLPSLRNSLHTRLVGDKLIIALVIIFAALVSLIPGKADRYLDRPAYAGDKIDTSTRDRLTAYRNSLPLIKENPILGSGYGTFWKAFRPFTNHPNVIKRSDENIVLYRMHNDLLQITVELGLAGAVLCLLIVALSYKYGFSLLKDDRSSGERLILFGILLSLSASLAHSLVDFPLLKPSSAEQLWLYLGLVSGFYARAKSKSFFIGQAWIKISSAIFVCLLIVALSVYYRAYLLGSYYARKAELSYKNKNCADALRYIDKSENTFRHDFYVHKLRVSIQIGCNGNMTSLYDVLSEELVWDNTDVMALLKKGYILLDSNWLDAAEKNFKSVMYLIPHRASGYVGEAYVLISRGDNKGARKLLDLLQSRFPDDPDVKRAVAKLNDAQANKRQ